MGNWHIGQKVVCVDAGTPLFRGATLQERTLRNGAVYTITGIKDSCCTEGVCFSLYGVHGKTACPYCFKTDGGCWKNEIRFHPLDALAEQVERIEKEGAPVEPELQEA